jgi:hypothetical protein
LVTPAFSGSQWRFMNEEEKPNLDLSGLDFGPAWAKNDAPARDYSKETGPRKGRDSRGGGPRRDNRDNRKGGDRRQNDRRREGGPSQDRRKGGKDGPQNQRGDRRQRQPETPAPEGFTAEVMPVEEGLDNLAREIKGGGRTYSVFDLARVVMGSRERYNVNFNAPKGQTFLRCKSDNSLWLARDEALQHFWQDKLFQDFYEEVTQTVDPPKGNFPAVAKCGFSGEWLGPPNYHGYPAAVAKMHAERFSHMSLEDYKRRIQNESSEEAINAWLESQTTETHYRPLTAEEITARRKQQSTPKAEEKAETESTSTEDSASPEKSEESVAEAPDSTTEESLSPQAETAVAPVESETETPPVENEETATEESAGEEQPSEAELLKTRAAVEEHFKTHHFDQLFVTTDRAWVSGDITAKLLSPGLLTLLKNTTAEERRYPSKLTPILCRQLSGRHLAVFKWKKKLKAGPARPHAIPTDLNLADRPKQLLEWTEKNSSKNLEDLWKDCLPENADDEVKRNYYHDLHWLLNEGYVLLMADGTIHLAKGRMEDKQTSKPAKAEKKESPSEAPEPPNEDGSSQESR